MNKLFLNLLSTGASRSIIKFARVGCMRGNFLPYNKSLNNLVSSVYTRKISDLDLLCMDLASLGPYCQDRGLIFFEYRPHTRLLSNMYTSNNQRLVKCVRV